MPHDRSTGQNKRDKGTVTERRGIRGPPQRQDHQPDGWRREQKTGKQTRAGGDDRRRWVKAGGTARPKPSAPEAGGRAFIILTLAMVVVVAGIAFASYQHRYELASSTGRPTGGGAAAADGRPSRLASDLTAAQYGMVSRSVRTWRCSRGWARRW
jgi:hypothetical protein